MSSSNAADVRMVHTFLFFDALAQSLATPLLPRRVLGFDPDVDAAAWSLGWLELAWALPQLVAAPALGRLSDAIGRRPLLVLSACALGGELVLDALATGITALFAGRVLCGLGWAGHALAFAHLASGGDPGARLARGTAAIWAGILVGPPLGALVPHLPLAFALAAASAAVAGIAALGVGEGRGVEALPIAAGGVDRWIGAFALSALAVQGTDQLLVLLTAERYGWSALAFGVAVSGAVALALASQAWLVPWVDQRRGPLAVARLGLLAQATGTAWIAFASSGPSFLAAYGLATVGGASRAALAAAIAAATPAGDQGARQGRLAGVAAAASIAGPPVFGWLYAVGPAGAGAFAVSAVCLLAAAWLARSRPGTGARP